ncbi:hypothetical protein Zmor_002912 [Zophobas morio]|uniref:Uncharacterized protein n=1 Tax=Zophobas morio TaxID=2755281 RepID=A0AA38M0P6_9CUCU|nr:hypothetical protein Zmor_002912 [Zophobas morio]
MPKTLAFRASAEAWGHAACLLWRITRVFAPPALLRLLLRSPFLLGCSVHLDGRWGREGAPRTSVAHTLLATAIRLEGAKDRRRCTRKLDLNPVPSRSPRCSLVLLAALDSNRRRKLLRLRPAPPPRRLALTLLVDWLAL